MEDSELNAIRQKRMQEIQSQYQGLSNMNQKEEAEKKRQEEEKMEEARKNILSQLLTPEARERLARIALVKPEKARSVEDMIIRAGQTGQLFQKIDESKLIQLLEQINEKKTETKIKIQRKKRFDSDEEDF